MPMFLDYRTPFVRMAQDYDVVFIREGEQVVIPCLVSVENLNVTLYTVSVYKHTYSPALFGNLLFLFDLNQKFCWHHFYVLRMVQ